MKNLRLGKTEYLMAALALVTLAVIFAFKVFDSPRYQSLEAVSVTITGQEASESETEPVNINTASLEELMTLKDIGKKRALAIIEYRNENGPFTSVDGLTEIEGIGLALVEANRDKIVI